MEKKPKAIDYALFLITRRSRTVHEIKEKLARKKFETQEIESTVDRLKAVGLLDDERYAKAYVFDKLEFNRRGKFRLSMELIKKGVSKELIDNALSTVEEGQELSVARSLVESRLRQWQGLEPAKRSARMLGLLQRRGFSARVVRTILEEQKTGRS